jgi:excisionase family DNA binding protein
MTDTTLLDAAQVAEILHVSERYVWRLGREGELSRVELPGRYVRFRRSDVEVFIEDRTTPTRPPARTGAPAGSSVLTREHHREPRAPRERF